MLKNDYYIVMPGPVPCQGYGGTPPLSNKWRTLNMGGRSQPLFWAKAGEPYQNFDGEGFPSESTKAPM